MNEKKFISSLKDELKSLIDLEYKNRVQSFFKETIFPIGVRSKDLNNLEKKYFKYLKYLNKKDFFNIINSLLQEQEHEIKKLAFKWLYRRRNDFTKTDFKVFERWLKKYVNNWEHCDSFLTHSLGYLIYSYPELIDKTDSWIKSNNRWLRRSASIILIYSFKYHKNKKEFNRFFSRLKKIILEQISDSDDLVQKGYGWSAKEASNVEEGLVFRFIYKHKNKLPRTALRYAIEKMNLEYKRKAMLK
ncbi:DNA alkylation repair protein [Patescibacteria group bacterium]|nr:DNA alkylation repair protein [Patescibacteria group bacterium]